MNNNFPQGQTSQNSSGMYGGRVYRPVQNRMMHHNNGMQAQPINYVQQQMQQCDSQIGPSPTPTYSPPVNPYGGQQSSQASPPPGIYMPNNAMGAVYAPSTYNNPVNLPHPAAASPTVLNGWSHPAGGASQVTSASPHNVMYQPHNGYASPIVGMHVPNYNTSSGNNLSHNIPTSQAPSTAGVPAYSFDFVPNQHGTFQHGQAQHGHVQPGPAQHRNVQRRIIRKRYTERVNVKHEAGQDGSNIPETSQPGAGTTAGVNTIPAPSTPAQDTGHRGIEANTANLPETVYLTPGEYVDQVYAEWREMLSQPQHGQAMGQYPGPAGQPGEGDPAETPGGHVPSPSGALTAPFTEEELRHYAALYHFWLVHGPQP